MQSMDDKKVFTKVSQISMNLESHVPSSVEIETNRTKKSSRKRIVEFSKTASTA